VGPEDRQFPDFYVSQYGRLRRLGFLLTGDWAEGEELAQETLVRIYWRWSLVRRQGHPEAYARKVLVNRHRSVLRRQSFSDLAGRRSSGRRPDGRAFLAGDQGGVLGYHIAWAYRCEIAPICPDAGPWRVLRLDVEGTGGQEGLKVRRVARRLVDSIRPITNALPPTRATVAEEEGLFADAPKVVGRGGQGDYAWEMVARKGSGQDYWIETRRQNGELFMGESFGELDDKDVAWIFCAPSRERATATLVSGLVSETVAKVALEVEGQPPVEVATFRKKGFPFTFWVVAPLPPDARPRSFTGLDAAGQQVAKGTEFAGYPGGCR
jgi:Sigma-70 region 2